MDEANTNQATPYNLRRRPIEFKVVNRVLKISTKLCNKANYKAGKLFHKYEGPYVIKRKVSSTVYELKNLKGKSVGEWNINNFKLEITSSNRDI